MDDSELERIKMKKMAELLSGGKKGEESMEWPSEPVEATDMNFDELVSTYPLVVVDFWAAWCAPCRAIAPIVKELAHDYAGKIVFAKLNVDENPRTAARFGIMSIPTLLIFREGKPVDAIIGAVPRRAIESKLRQYL